jgi:hypothetical protein
VPTLSDYDVELVVGFIIILLMFAYAAFWGFNLRTKLTIKLYRTQALGIGLVSIGIGYFAYFFGFPSNISPLPSSGALGNLTFVSIFYAILPLFYWTDVSLLTLRESDPLERDQFQWSRVRIVLWLLIIATLIINTVLTIYISLPGNQNAQLQGPFILQAFTVVTPLAVPLTAAAILLPLAARRSRDFTMRRHLKWFALSAVFLASAFVVSVLVFAFLGTDTFPNPFLASGIQILFFFAAGYSLYRSARAIVPLYRFPENIQIRSTAS